MQCRAGLAKLRPLPFAAIVVVLGSPGIVNATTGGVSISWTAPAECPTPADVSASVGHLLGRAPTLPEGRELEVKARAWPCLRSSRVEAV